jgi:Alginate export
MQTKPLVVFLFVLAASLLPAPASAQYVPPSPPVPTSGAINDFLRAESPEFKPWDFIFNERVRGEDKSNAGTTHAGSNFDFFSAPPTTNSNDYWLSRLMVRVGYTADWFNVVAEVRSSYSFGDNRYNATAPGEGLADNDGPLQLQLGYVQIGNLKKYPLLVKLGRQELTYGDQRLIGAAYWLNIPHTFDAIKVRYQNSNFGVDLFTSSLVYTTAGEFNKSNWQDMLSGAYFDFPTWSETNVTEAYVFSRNVARGIVTDDWSQVPAPFRFPAPQDLYTFGFRTKTKPGQPGPWDYGFEMMWQGGNRTAVFPGTTVAVAKTAPRLEQDAWAIVAQAGYTFPGSALKPRLALLASAASGDHNVADRNSETFQNILPSNHGLYGAMDLSGLQNIVDLRLSASVKPTAKTSVALDLHQQFLQSTSDYWYNVAGVPRNTPGAAPGSGRGYGINPTYSSNLGQEIDVVGGWTVARGLLLEAGVGHFFRGDYIKESLRVVGSKDANYCYIQATLNL